MGPNDVNHSTKTNPYLENRSSADATSKGLAQAPIGAEAYVTGSSVLPEAEEPGRHLIAHEAAHVVQPRHTPIEPNLVPFPNRSLEAEAEVVVARIQSPQ